MNITEQDCINGREAVRRDGEIVSLANWTGTEEYPVLSSGGLMRRKDGLFSRGEENPEDLLCWRDELVHEAGDFTVTDVQRALDTNGDGLFEGFVWEASPQGDGYWSTLATALYRGEPLPDDARDILLASIAVAKREAETKPAETPLVQIVVSVPLDRVADLHGFAAGLCGHRADGDLT